MENLNNDDLEQVKEAAREGAKEGAGRKSSRGFKGFLIALVVVVVAAIVIPIVAANVLKWQIKKQLKEFTEQLSFDTSADDHDLVLDDDVVLGYTAADFAEAILGKQTHLQKIEVLEQKVSDVVTLVDTGLFNIKIFTKTQLLTYNGTQLIRWIFPSSVRMM